MRGSQAGSGGTLIVLLTPEITNLPLRLRLPCRFVATNALKAAIERGKERIRVENPGCVCEFDTAALAAHVRPRLPYMGSLVRGWGVQGHCLSGNSFEARNQVWPGLPAQGRVSGVAGAAGG